MLKVAEKPIRKKAIKPSPVVQISQPEAERVRAWFNDRLEQCKSAPFSEIMTVTPGVALILLSRNDGNRNVSQVNLERIKTDILASRFAFNGEAIIISRDGQLIDGQHRLRAVAETGVPIRSVVVFGPEIDARNTVDQGNVRTVGHYLSMSGHSDANALASVAGFAWQYKQSNALVRNPERKATKTEILIMAEHYRDMADSLQFVSRARVNTVCSRTMLAFCHWALSYKATSGADAFMDSLISGANLKPGDPILYCRNRLIAMRGFGSSNAHERAELIFRAWNAHRLGKSVDRIVITGSKFPALES